MRQEALRGNVVLRSVWLVVVALAASSVEAAIEVYPEMVRLTSRRSRVQLVITVREADGRLRDVTHQAPCVPANRGWCRSETVA